MRLGRIGLSLLLAVAVVAFPVAAAAQIVNGRVLSNGQFTCTTTAAQVLPANLQRQNLILYNSSTTATNIIYVGSNNGPVGGPAVELTAANGFALDVHTAGQPAIILALPAYLDTLRCISGAGSPVLHYIEISR